MTSKGVYYNDLNKYVYENKFQRQVSAWNSKNVHASFKFYFIYKYNFRFVLS